MAITLTKTDTLNVTPVVAGSIDTLTLDPAAVGTVEIRDLNNEEFAVVLMKVAPGGKAFTVIVDEKFSSLGAYTRTASYTHLAGDLNLLKVQQTGPYTDTHKFGLRISVTNNEAAQEVYTTYLTVLQRPELRKF